MIISVAGTYGVISYSTSQRTRELGIRVALGAGRAQILRLLIGPGVGLTLAGVGAGLAGAFALIRLLSGMLFGVTPTDPMTFVAASAGLSVIAIVTCYVPARRASKVDPGIVLREE